MDPSSIFFLHSTVGNNEDERQRGERESERETKE